MKFITVLFILGVSIHAITAENILERAKEFFEEVDLIARPNYLSNTTWTTIGDALMEDFYRNDVLYFASILGLDKGLPAKILSMAKIPLTLISGKACQFCSAGLSKTQKFVDENIWIDYALVGSCAGFLIVDTRAALLCTVPMLGVVVLLHHAPANSICNALPFCSDLEKRSVDPNELFPGVNITDPLNFDDFPDALDLSKRSKDDLLGLMLDGHSRRSVDAIIDAYNQIPDKTKLFLERKTSELIRQGANVTVEDFAKATKDIIDDLILRL